MQFDKAKLDSAILYICSKCPPAKLGAVKLHKVLYYSDMLHYAEFGSPITGAEYRKRPFGPTCDALLESLDRLSRQGLMQARFVDYYGFKKKEFIVTEEADTSRFNDSEIALIDDMIDFVCVENSAKTISEFSHNRAWELAEFGDVLPYVSVFQIFPTEVSLEALAWAR